MADRQKMKKMNVPDWVNRIKTVRGTTKISGAGGRAIFGDCCDLGANRPSSAAAKNALSKKTIKK